MALVVESHFLWRFRISAQTSPLSLFFLLLLIRFRPPFFVCVYLFWIDLLNFFYTYFLHSGLQSSTCLLTGIGRARLLILSLFSFFLTALVLQKWWKRVVRFISRLVLFMCINIMKRDRKWVYTLLGSPERRLFEIRLSFFLLLLLLYL